MNHRHLLPNEIDLLVDGEAGFGVAPLVAHVEECDACRAEVGEGHRIAAMLGDLPRFAPSFGLADRVMARVPVFVPWHVAARDAVAGLMPASRPLRVLAMVGSSVFAALFTAAALWVLASGDIVAFASAAAGDQLRTAFATGSRQLVGVLFGDQALVAMTRAGARGMAIAAGGFVAAAGTTLLGLRAIAAANRQRA